MSFQVEEAISLGWNCKSASYGVSSGLRTKKEHGYKTCPFDEMISNLTGLITCLQEDFASFCDTNHLTLLQMPASSKYLNTHGHGDVMIFHTKYNFLFNHEAPGHANLYQEQQWPGGIDHFTKNNFEAFVQRYQRRIDNFRQLIQNTNVFVHFILTRPSCLSQEKDLTALRETLTLYRPSNSFDIILLDFEVASFRDHLQLMQFNDQEHDIQRLEKALQEG